MMSTKSPETKNEMSHEDDSWQSKMLVILVLVIAGTVILAGISLIISVIKYMYL